MNFISEYYDWIKIVHTVAVICWMAGLFYLPRLFVYHTEYPENGKMLEIMEERLFRYIMQPAMHISLLAGILMVLSPGYVFECWVHVKLTCVFLLVVLQFFLGYWRKQLKQGVCSKSSRFFRVINEIPTVLLILIITFVIIRPF